MKKTIITSIILSGLLVSSPLYAESQSADVYAKLPVKEVTIFKDGHTFVLHEGSVATNENGDVVLDELPNPVMGTFWAYSADSANKLECVISSRDEVDVEKIAMTVEELLISNIDKEILFRDSSSGQYQEATILRVLEDEKYPMNSQGNKVALLKTLEGVKAIPVSQIQSVTFLGNPSEKITRKETKDTMTLKLNRSGQQASSSAHVGMAYVQKGIRWIPSYRVEIDEKGKAVIKLQGTIINELTDLEDVSAHLVVGVPTFTFQDTPDPISFQETVARLSSHFRQDSSTAYAFSNAIMSQRGGAYQVINEPQNTINLGPEMEGSGKAEDLFIFDLDHVSLKKGQRMVVPITEYTLSYEDIYTVDIDFSPPLEMRRNFSSDQHLQLARLFHAPKAMHKIRLTNKSEYPLTTAPATIFKDGRILAQGMMQFTSIGGTGDLEVTTAIDIKVKSSDNQTENTRDAVTWDGDSYMKIDMEGFVELSNYGDKTVKIHIKRSVLGNMDEATQDGIVKQLGHGYDGLVFEDGVPFWWNWCSWPWWWYHFNSIGQAEWDIGLKSQETIKLDYEWHYYWR